MSSGKQEFNEHASKRTTSMRFTLSLVASVLTALTTAASAGGQQPDRGFASSARARALPGAYQGRRDAERTDRFAYKGKIWRNKRLFLWRVALYPMANFSPLAAAAVASLHGVE